MVVKNSPARYGQTVGAEKLDIAPLEESLRFLLAGTVSYELRTTVVEEFHDPEATEQMGKWLCSLIPGIRPGKFFLQPFRDRDSVLAPGLHTPTAEKLDLMRQTLSRYTEAVAVRGTD